MPEFLPYDPGVLPTKHAPLPGEGFELQVDGLPPRKNRNRSLRNIAHPFYDRFVRLRAAAIEAMDGRAPYRGIVGLELTMHCAERLHYDELIEFMGGVMDTLDGSHGPTFTYLPIVYEDDCQVSMGNIAIHPSSDEFYRLQVAFKHDEEIIGEQVGAQNP